jgi:O-antigen/teichoic acid export membrane protein
VRVRRSILNFASTALLMAVTMCVAFPAAPYLVSWLGKPTLGGLRVVNAAFGYLGLLELGLGGAIAPLLAAAIQRDEPRTLHETVAAGARAYAWVALGSIVIGSLLTPVIPWFAGDVDPAQREDLRRAWWVQLGGFVPLFVLPLRSVLEAAQLSYVVNLLLLGQSLLVTGLSLVLAWAGWGITGQAVALVIGNWAFSLSLVAGASRHHPGLLRSILTRPTSVETRRALRRLSAPTLIVNLCGRVAVLSDELVVGGMLGAARVVTFAYTQKLAQLGQSILQAVGGASWAALAQLHAHGHMETFNKRLIELTRMIAVVGVVGLVPVVGYDRAFVRLWLGPRFYGGDLVIMLASVNAVLLATQSLWAWCFVATGRTRELVPLTVVTMLVNLAASVLATHLVGLPGPLVGSTVGFLAVGFWMLPLRLQSLYGTPPRALWRAVAIPSGAGFAAAALLGTLTRFHEPKGWLALAAEMTLSALVMLALGLTVLLTSEDRALWRQRLALLRLTRSSTVPTAAETSEPAR